MEINIKNISPKAIEVCKILSNAGYQAYLVGGCVRDLLLGQEPKDYDIITDATPQQIISLFPKTYPTGLQHGTVTVSMGEGVQNHFEVTTFRIEGEYLDGRRPEQVHFVMHVEQDLARRDLTINAIAFDPITHRIVDPYSGIIDLQQGIIKAVGNPDARFKEDGLRIMRVARFAARFGYQVDPKTLLAMQHNLETLQKVSMERIRDEFCKTLMTRDPCRGLKILLQTEALFIPCPTLKNPYLNIFMELINTCQGDLETKIAFLYSNVKIEQAKIDLLNLKFSNKELQRIFFLLRLLDKYGEQNGLHTVNLYKGFMALIKNHSPDYWMHTLNQFITLTGALGFPVKEEFAKFKDEIVYSKKELQINGNDLLLLGIPQGSQIKDILEKCYLEVLREPRHNNKEYLKKLIQSTK